jgi:hypothetical protein
LANGFMSRNKLYTITVKILTLNDYVARVQTNAKLYQRSSFGHKELPKFFSIKLGRYFAYL